MTRQNCYFLPATAAKDLLENGMPRLAPVVTGDMPPRGFQLVDTFDGEVRKSGALLLKTGDLLELMSAQGGSTQQSSAVCHGYVADLDDGAVKDALAGVSPLRALQTIGEGDLQEVTAAFVDGAQKTRVRARFWFMTSNQDGAAAIVLLQGLRGYDKALEQLRAQIATSGGKSLNDPSFYAALFPEQALYNAKPEILIDRKEAAYDVANDIIKSYLPVARANESGIIADTDIEFLHDYRIALRKIRSVLSLFAGVYADKTTASLKSRFSGLMAQTGQLRDLDVYLADKAKFYPLLPASLHPGLDELFGLFSNRREDAKTKLIAHLESDAYAAEMDSLTLLFDKRKKLRRGPKANLSALRYSSTLIWKRYRKVCDIAAGIDDRTEDEEVHRLRIHCKKLRYLMEFFGPVFPKKEFNSILRPLKRLQDNLGLFNDYSVQQESLRALLNELNKTPDAAHLEIAQSVGALIVVLHRKQLEERARVVESFARFNDQKTQDTFRALFKSGKAAA